MNVISLKHHLKSKQLPPYLGVKTNIGEEDETAFLLSTKIMRWNESIWLLDLRRFMAYWKWTAKKRGEELLSFFENLLIKTFGEGSLFSFAHHPWQCALLLEVQEEQFTYLGTPQGDQFYKKQKWEVWPVLQESLLPHLPKGEQADFKRMCGRFERFVKRMGVFNLFSLEKIQMESMERRFGKWWGRIWTWTFEGFVKEEDNFQGDLFLGWGGMGGETFPWHQEKIKEPPQVERYLDVPLLEWDHMVEYLKEDMAKLLKHFPRLKNQRITEMNWQVTLENLKVHTCTLVFRNPHSLKKDRGDFETTLFQAYYSYLNLMQSLETREDDLDYPLRMACIGWKFEVTEAMDEKGCARDLLQQGWGSTSELERLETENKLPATLLSFGLKESFYPETSYGIRQNLESLEEPTPWLMSSCKRPLFIRKSLMPFNVKSFWKKTFLERAARRWWGGDDPELGERDYYIVSGERGTLWWAFRDQWGKWYKHGLFS